jgi:predicted permease
MRALLFSRSVEAERDEELDFHHRLAEQQHQRESETFARSAAAREFGNRTYYKEEMRHMGALRWFDAFSQDLRYGLRTLLRAPAFTLIAIGTLALGVGANSAMFGIVDAMLFRAPSGVRDPESVVRLRIETPSRGGEPAAPSDIASYPDYADIRDNARGLAAVAAYVRTTTPIGAGDESRRELTILVSGNYFGLLGATPAIGRLLQPSDDGENSGLSVAVLSWDYWQRALSGDPRVVGTAVRIGGQPYTVVGIAARHFVGTDLGAPAAWLPLGIAPRLGFDAENVRRRFAQWVSIVGRLSSGVTIAQATEGASTALQVGRDGGKGGGSGAPRVELSRLAGAGSSSSDDGRRSQQVLPVSLWFLAITGIVLLIACANVANLMLARATQRAHELAVRASIGATRRRLVRQLMTESVLLATGGAVAGLVLAQAGTALLPRAIPIPPLPPLIDGRVLAFTLLVTVATSIAFGVAPALRAARTELLATLNASVRAGGTRSSTRNLLVVIQLAASVVLLVSAALFIRSLRNVRAIDPGFDAERLVSASGDTRSAPLSSEQSDDYWRRAAERIRSLPGVQGVALGAGLPFETGYTMPAGVPGAGEPVAAQLDFADAAYFSTLGIQVLEGRAFIDADQRPTSAPVVIINRALARQLFGATPAIGRWIRAGPVGPGGACAEVVGIAEDVRFTDVTHDPVAFFYRPFGQRSAGWPPVLHVRTAPSNTGALTADVRRELLRLDGSVQYVRVQPLTDLLAPQLAPWKTGTLMFSLFGALGLVLAAVGLYGVIALLVAQRTHEIGVRVALGAQVRDVYGLLLAEGARLIVIGLTLGGASAAAASQLFTSMMYGVTRWDPVAYVATAAMLSVIGLCAVVIPARRATRVDPVIALRAN